jgi:hypothetical protein
MASWSFSGGEFITVEVTTISPHDLDTTNQRLVIRVEEPASSDPGAFLWVLCAPVGAVAVLLSLAYFRSRRFRYLPRAVRRPLPG